MADDQAVYDARSEATPALALASGLLVVLAGVSGAKGWQLLYLPWWIWLVPASAAVVLMLDLLSGVRGPTIARSRAMTVSLLAVLVVGNLVALVSLVAGVVSTSVGDLGGGELLLTAAVIWTTNVVAFGLLFWEIADGGPVARSDGSRARPDFQFPQDEDSDIAPEGWAPHAWDYLYVSLTNAIAFSPTDAMPLTWRAKALMGLGSVISVVTVLLVGARAVNVLGT
jgi:uncharacterized membrane protein